MANNISPKRKLQFDLLEKIKKSTIEESKKNAFELDYIQFSVPFGDIDFDNIDITFFYKHTKDLSENNNKQIKLIWSKILANNKYFEHFSTNKIIYVFDTWENVKENYDGSYFYRSRG